MRAIAPSLTFCYFFVRKKVKEKIIEKEKLVALKIIFLHRQLNTLTPTQNFLTFFFLIFNKHSILCCCLDAPAAKLANMLTRILVLHPCGYYRIGLVNHLQSETGYEALFPVENLCDALKAMELHAPDIIMVCSELVFNEEPAWEALVRKHPAVIILMEKADSRLLHAATDAGVLGLILKTAQQPELTNVLNNVRSGMLGLCRTLTPLARRKETVPEVWTAEEITLAQQICQAKTNKEISKVLHKSVHTIAKKRASLKKKCGVESIAGLVRFAIEKGWIKILLLIALNGQVGEMSEGLNWYF